MKLTKIDINNWLKDQFRYAEDDKVKIKYVIMSNFMVDVLLDGAKAKKLYGAQLIICDKNKTEIILVQEDGTSGWWDFMKDSIAYHKSTIKRKEFEKTLKSEGYTK